MRRYPFTEGRRINNDTDSSANDAGPRSIDERPQSSQTESQFAIDHATNMERLTALRLKPHADFVAGVRETIPSAPGLVPFAMLVGITMIETGLSEIQAAAMSVVMFSGAAQLTAVELLSINSPPVVIVLAALIVNSRFMMFSASIAPQFADYSSRSRWFLAFFLGDVHYALTISKSRNEDVCVYWYYLGSAVTVYVIWVGATILGVVAGSELPVELDFGFTIALIFLVLMFSLIDSLLDAVVALATGGLSIATAGFPYDTGLIVATALGVAIGIALREVRDD